ncbi:hypothetical protein ABZP36_018703 [Zizania latifolia]
MHRLNPRQMSSEDVIALSAKLPPAEWQERTGVLLPDEETGGSSAAGTATLSAQSSFPRQNNRQHSESDSQKIKTKALLIAYALLFEKTNQKHSYSLGANNGKKNERTECGLMKILRRRSEEMACWFVVL